MIGQWLHERLGQPFLVENRPGSGGNLGVEAVVRSPADGYTLLILTVAHSVNKSVYEKLSYDLLRDIAPVAALFRAQYLMMVNPRSPAKRSRNSSPTSRRTPARSTSGRTALALPAISPASCSRS